MQKITAISFLLLACQIQASPRPQAGLQTLENTASPAIISVPPFKNADGVNDHATNGDDDDDDDEEDFTGSIDELIHYKPEEPSTVGSTASIKENTYQQTQPDQMKPADPPLMPSYTSDSPQMMPTIHDPTQLVKPDEKVNASSPVIQKNDQQTKPVGGMKNVTNPTQTNQNSNCPIPLLEKWQTNLMDCKSYEGTNQTVPMKGCVKTLSEDMMTMKSILKNMEEVSKNLTSTLDKKDEIPKKGFFQNFQKVIPWFKKFIH